MMSVSSFKAQARFHFWGILLSIVVSLIVGLPAIIFHFSSDYHGIDMLKTNAEDFYVSEIQEVYDGHPGLGNASFADQKSSLYLFPPFSPNLIATIGRIIGVNAVGAVLVTRFIFAFIISFLVYLFAWQLTGRRAVGLVAAAGITLAYNLTDPSNFRSFLFHFYTDNPKIGFLGYGRPINPSVSSLLFFAYLNCFWMYLYRSGKRVWGVASAVILGVSFYSYLFTWLFIFSFNGFLFAIYTFKKDLVMIKKILAVSLGGVILGIPYAFHILEVMHSP
jgi:hypothetical protein